MKLQEYLAFRADHPELADRLTPDQLEATFAFQLWKLRQTFAGIANNITEAINDINERTGP